MGKYEDLTHDIEWNILADVINDQGVNNILSIDNVYSILREHFNNDILEEFERRNPEKFETYTNFYSHCGEEWEDDDCDSFHNDHCPVCDMEIEPYKSVGNYTDKEFNHFDKG